MSAGGGAVLVARSDEPIDHRVHQFWLVLVGLGVSVLGVSLIISSRLSRWVVDPLRRLDRQAAALGQGQLSLGPILRTDLQRWSRSRRRSMRWLTGWTSS